MTNPVQTNAAILERKELLDRAQGLCLDGETKNRQQIENLRDRVKSIVASGLSTAEQGDKGRGLYATALNESLKPGEISEEEYTKELNRALQFNHFTELRNMVVGSQSKIYTQGPLGGYTVPNATTAVDIQKGEAQTCELLNPDVCTVIQEKNMTTQPLQVSGWDLSTIRGFRVIEASTQNPIIAPVVSGKVLGAWMYSAPIEVSLEFETDSPLLSTRLSEAAGVSLARAMSTDITLGTGSGQPGGIYTLAPSSGITLGAGPFGNPTGSITQEGLAAVFFSVNRQYRNSQKAAWLVSDSVFEQLRVSSDNLNRPLLSIENGDEVRLFGKRVYVAPDLPNVGGSPATNGALLFGDLSHFLIRLSAVSVSRLIQTGDITGSILRGMITLRFLQRCDSTLFDPSGGSNPPIVSAVAQHA